MADPAASLFAPRGSAEEIEGGLVFQPKFDPQGLIPAIVTDAGSGEVLMFAWMNAEAVAETLRAWLGRHGSWDGAATVLGVHRNSVRHRIAHAERLLGRDLSTADARASLWLALTWLD